MLTTNHKRESLGFTLFELLLVLSVVIALFGIAIPSLATFSHQNQSQNNLRIVRTSLLKARQQAIDSGSTVRWDASQWSGSIEVHSIEPCVFYPNGTSSDATITVSSPEGECGTLHVLGVTGSITSGDIQQ